MPDLLAGTPITALDTTPTVSDTEAGEFTHDAITFGIDADTGTYVECGTSFIAPTTGRVKISHGARVGNTGASGATEVAPAVRIGATIGAGATVIAASSNNAVRSVGTTAPTAVRAGSPLLVSGLTPGDVYNVRLEHRVSGGTGTTGLRHVIVEPST